jgi:hypothetical protein
MTNHKILKFALPLVIALLATWLTEHALALSFTLKSPFIVAPLRIFSLPYILPVFGYSLLIRSIYGGYGLLMALDFNRFFLIGRLSTFVFWFLVSFLLLRRYKISRPRR